MSNSTRQKLEQGRAQEAYNSIKKFVDNNKGSLHLDDYKSYSKKFPMMVKTNGLGPALAFIKSKNKIAYEQIYSDITNWLKVDFKQLLDLTNKDLIDAILDIEDSANYRAVTNEVLAFMNWHRRFTEGMIAK